MTGDGAAPSGAYVMLPQPLPTDCRHGLYGECAPSAHDQCRHCERPIKAVFVVPGRPDWQHQDDGALACPTTRAEPHGTVSGGVLDG